MQFSKTTFIKLFVTLGYAFVGYSHRFGRRTCHTVSEIKDGMKKVAARPGQWWDKLIAAAIGAVASGLVAAVLSQVLR